MLYTLRVVATMIVAFAAGIVINRYLYKFFDWFLDFIERWDDEDR